MQRTMVLLREYRDGDFEAIFALDAACFTSEFRFSRSAMRRFVTSRRARVRVAEADGEVAGFCIVHVEPAPGGCAGYVVTLDVAERWRRQGVAARLLEELTQQAGQDGCRTMLLHVSVENAAAVRFYEALGWTRVHTVEGFYGAGLDAFVYRRAVG